MPLRSLTWCSSALTSVPLAWPAAGMHDHPRRLVDDDDVGILDRGSRSGSASGCGVAATGSGTSIEKCLSGF